MALFDDIVAIHTELTAEDFGKTGTIELQDDGDGVAYICKWDYSKPLPAGMKLGK